MSHKKHGHHRHERAKKRPRDARQALFRLARKLEPEPGHAFQVRKNAERLFAALAPIHGLKAAEWPLLEAAAVLHDIGQRDGFKGHHKRSRDMILAREWPGLETRGRAIVACVARYHRKGLPKPDHKVYETLPAPDQALVARMAALLRIADGLDRAHRASVCGIRAEITPGQVVLHVAQRHESPADLHGALRKADLFEQVYATKIDIIAA
jgi:exopolyphosphatase/guanosine-5'-triphosphate,3'-diphosphate pyrophosphatase